MGSTIDWSQDIFDITLISADVIGHLLTLGSADPRPIDVF